MSWIGTRRRLQAHDPLLCCWSSWLCACQRESLFFWWERLELEKPPLYNTWPESQVNTGLEIDTERWAGISCGSGDRIVIHQLCGCWFVFRLLLSYVKLHLGQQCWNVLVAQTADKCLFLLCHHSWSGHYCVFNLGHRLRVVNMNQQSDTADLLGG